MNETRPEWIRGRSLVKGDNEKSDLMQIKTNIEYLMVKATNFDEYELLYEAWNRLCSEIYNDSEIFCAEIFWLKGII